VPNILAILIIFGCQPSSLAIGMTCKRLGLNIGLAWAVFTRIVLLGDWPFLEGNPLLEGAPSVGSPWMAFAFRLCCLRFRWPLLLLFCFIFVTFSLVHSCAPALPGVLTLILRSCIAGLSWNMIFKLKYLCI
jgi:hypothetical protein